MPSLKPISFPRYSASLPNPGSVNNPDPSLRPLDPIFAIEPVWASLRWSTVALMKCGGWKLWKTSESDSFQLPQFIQRRVEIVILERPGDPVNRRGQYGSLDEIGQFLDRVGGVGIAVVRERDDGGDQLPHFRGVCLGRGRLLFRLFGANVAERADHGFEFGDRLRQESFDGFGGLP